MAREHSSPLSVLHPIQWTAMLLVVCLGVIPFSLAISRLWYITGTSPLFAIASFPSHAMAIDALGFSLLEALLSTILTIFIGLPIAMSLGRFEWRYLRLRRTLLFIPFVSPPIVAAVGFLAIFSPDGPFALVGLDLRNETGLIGWLADQTGWAHPGHMLALVLAHAWFNVSLMIRFVEPIVAQLNPAWEEQLRLLPGGTTMKGRMRYFWAPLLGPAVLVASVYTFLFSFTSFALVKWLAPSSHTLESLLALHGDAAGIAGYRLEVNEAVLSIACVQMIIILIMLILAGQIESWYSRSISQYSEHGNRKRHGRPSALSSVIINLTIVCFMLPFFAILRSSFRYRRVVDGQATYGWTLEGWRRAFAGDASTVTLFDALSNSLLYAFLTACVAIPLGYAVASGLATLRSVGHRKLAAVLDSLCMLPLSLSAVMVGLGIVIGMLRFSPILFTFPLLPVLPHMMLVLPFVIRLLLPALERIDSQFLEQAQLLQLSRVSTWWHSKGAFLKIPGTMAVSLCLAFSLGEFGASYLVMRVGSWNSLSILVDQVVGRPKFDPFVFPTAMALATVLMVTTFLILSVNEQIRRRGKIHDA